VLKVSPRMTALLSHLVTNFKFPGYSVELYHSHDRL